MQRVIVIGAGAAGTMAAIAAAEQGAEVLLIEKMKRLGRKLSITGKGRCNITNAAPEDEIIKHIPGNGRFLYSAIHAFNNQDVIRLFESLGVRTKVERGQRVFPVSDKASDVVEALEERLEELGVKVYTECRVKELITEYASAMSANDAEGMMLRMRGVRLYNGKAEEADAVIVATGGASYPGTGSSGDGQRLAASVGHTVIPMEPSLVPLETEETWVKEMSGLSLRNVKVTLLSEGKCTAEAFGEMMFTHFGVTGPVILSLSRTAAQELRKGSFVELRLNLKPALSEEQLLARVKRDFEQYNKKSIKNAMRDLLPAKLIRPVIDAAYMDEDKPVHQISRQERNRLVKTLQSLILTISATRPMAEAIVTAGGVSVRELHPKTMESKLIYGLYFAGEVVDVDGFTGGYNLQAAFSMGHAAGIAAAQKTGE
ncbi:NAD(P)/FAD-dependent oxidoreductase [Selenomonas sp. TAMA-11512]|uniref:NAD(P)/FAD-dependent oxidoreductase n=1 Tax=Selenomonas sp. TAMA-11512 TaxID=3095337 RepID=UPI0030918ECD|nr:NAD(P)/FAD-dependent oxidoreductase [Selenomonas sp. TAMA-11512]